MAAHCISYSMEPEMNAHDIGVVLVGGMPSHQDNYAAAFAAEGCRLLAVGAADRLSGSEADRHAELAHSLGLPLLRLDEALRMPGASVASIAVGMRHRAGVATTCAAAGLDLYLDKPLAGSTADARLIADAVAQAKVRAQVFSHVTAGWAQRARAAIGSGSLGRIVAVHADMLMAKGVSVSIAAAPRTESAAPTDFPEDIAKREMTDMGVYPVSLVAWLLGSGALTVNAATANHFFAEHLSRDVEDYGAMLLRFERGVTATITCGRTGWQSYHAPILSRVVVVGETGTLVFGTDQEQLLATAPGSELPQVDPADPMDMWFSTRKGVRLAPVTRRVSLDTEGPLDVAAFVEALTSGGEAGIGVREALHHCEILAAAYRSAAEQREVEVAAAGV
jgi:predicted dehydrogenase